MAPQNKDVVEDRAMIGFLPPPGQVLCPALWLLNYRRVGPFPKQPKPFIRSVIISDDHDDKDDDDDDVKNKRGQGRKSYRERAFSYNNNEVQNNYRIAKT